MEPFRYLQSMVAPLVRDDVDTDQIIPARFLTVTTRRGLAAGLFAGWRAAEGAAFPLDLPEYKGARILLVGRNFGCGSSREHAPWALLDAGFRAVVALSFADIFRNNAENCGLLPVVLDPAAHAYLGAMLVAHRRMPTTIDLEHLYLTIPDADGTCVSFDIDPFTRRLFLAGQDRLDYLLSHAERIAAHEAQAGAGPVEAP